ncbi:MAG: DUF433 domain-containing protein [Armatimonadetes bacterium]|nr:DUF433 domain-containing protein [Armatimonadota bacterium]
MVNWKAFVEVNPKIMQGKPVIKGTRIPVSLVLSYLAGGMTVDEILAEYPHLSREAILACIAFAYDVIELEACQADWSLRNNNCESSGVGLKRWWATT